MKLNGIHIDGFGIWRDLELSEIGPGITAFYGPNEAGKTTVLEFIRAMLYGPAADRGRYLPPIAGGRPGGHLTLNGPAEQVQICRTFDETPTGDRLRIHGEGQQPRSAEDLSALLGGIDQATFNNVYAVGLRELQELGTLSDTEAAEWLYSLTTGLDRVSLLEVMQRLEQSRESLLASNGSGGSIKSLTRRRDTLQTQVDRHVGQIEKWSQLHNRLDQLAGEIRELHTRRSELTHDGRTLEIALHVVPRWREREGLQQQLETYAGRIRLPADAVPKLEELHERVAAHRREADLLTRQRQMLREESDRLGINEVLVRNASRVLALGEQKDWLESLERQASAIRAELAEIQSKLASEDERLVADLRPSVAGRGAPEISEALLNNLRPHARATKICKRQLAAAVRQAEAREAAAQELEAQLQVSMPAASAGMPTDLEEAGELVSALRRRLHVEQKLQQAQRSEIELAQQNHDLLDRQELPLWIEASHTVLIIVAVVLFAIGLLASVAPAAWIGGVMLAVLVALRIFKYVGEEQVASRREGIERQIELVRKQLHDAQREQDELEQQLGPVEGSTVVKLQAAERHLEELEKLLPIDSKLREARREAHSAACRVEEARHKVGAAEAVWRSKLTASGLPQDWTPSDLRAVAGRYGQISELRMRVARRREDAEQRQREYAMLCERIQHLAEEVGLAGNDTRAPELLEHLQSELRGQQTKLAQRSRLRKRSRELKTKASRHLRAASALIQRLDTLLHQAGVETEADYRRLYQEQVRADELAQQRDALAREIAAAIGNHAPEEAFAKLLSSESAASLEAAWEANSIQLEEIEQKLHRAVEERGAVGQQLGLLEQDHPLAEQQFELAMVQTQLEQAIADWQVRAATCFVLERIRADYEKHRQPETLLEASRLFDNFTAGRYRRVWAPLAKKLLFVDTLQGETLPVEALSRGTREQLFLALRLALVALLARRGVSLPMVLDDVLVNFDTQRAARAANTLRDFAAAGHQVLVFTCHEHIAATLQSLDVDVRRLPNRFGDEPELPLAAPPTMQPLPREIEVQGETDGEELELEPPTPPAARPPATAYEEDEQDEQDEEDTLLDFEDALEPAPPPPRSWPSPAVPISDRGGDGQWIRIGPQVRRREFAERTTTTASATDGADVDEYGEDELEELDDDLDNGSLEDDYELTGVPDIAPGGESLEAA